MESNNWGSSPVSPQRRCDLPFSFKEDGAWVDTQVYISQARGKRPRELHFMNTETKYQSGSNVLLDIFNGLSESIAVATDKEFLQSPFGNIAAKKVVYDHADALSVVNKYPIFSRVAADSKGVMIVTFPKSPVMYPREDRSATTALLKSLAISHSNIVSGTNLRSTIFFNVGPQSGASLMQLHAQSYYYGDTSQNIGTMEYILQRSFTYWQDQGICLYCKSNSFALPKGFGSSDLVIWEDENVIVKSPYAPARFSQLRIIPRRHVRNIGELTSDELMSLGTALSTADFGIFQLLTNHVRRINPKDRSIAFRQFSDRDFHMFIDVYPVYMGFGGAEMTVPLYISPMGPESIARAVRELIALSK